MTDSMLVILTSANLTQQVLKFALKIALEALFRKEQQFVPLKTE
jgi:hypothetical protein